MILCIDTKDKRQVVVSLKKEGKVVESLIEENEYGSQVLLPLIIKLLRLYTGSSEEFRYSIGRLDGIEVDTGPGSFTGLKVGVSVANSLAFALKIPVNGKKIEDKLVY